MKYLLKFEERCAAKIERSGGKGANLVLLTQGGFPVPTGFIVTAQAYRDFIGTSGGSIVCAGTLAAHEPNRLRVADPRSGPRLCEAQRFMVPMRDRKVVEAFHEPDFGRDIALRCPHPRSSERHRCAAERGADGAARRPYQVQGFNARNFSGKAPHQPGGARLR